MSRRPKSHTEELESLAELPAVAVPALTRYLDLLALWNQRINLTGARDTHERVRLLVQPVLAMLPCIRGRTVLDIGSGNGSPGLVMALLAPDVHVTLLEPRQRRWAFLREAARQAGAERVRVERLRHDEYTGPPQDTVSVRALTLSLEDLARLTTPGGRILVMGTRPEPCALAVPVGSARVADLHVYDVVSRGTAP